MIEILDSYAGLESSKNVINVFTYVFGYNIENKYPVFSEDASFSACSSIKKTHTHFNIHA